MWEIVITVIEKHGTTEQTKNFSRMKTERKEDIIKCLQTDKFTFSKDYDEMVDIYYKNNPIAWFFARDGYRALQNAWVTVIQTKEENYDWIN